MHIELNKFSQFPLHKTFLVKIKAMNIDSSCQVPNLLTLDEWKQLNKDTSYKLYVDLSNKLHRKDLFIEQVLTGLKTKIDAHPCLGGEQGNNSEKQSASSPNGFGLFQEQVRDFKKKNDFTTLQENCVLGSSIIAKLYDDASIPLDVAIHAYRGSTTLEKLKVVDKYESKKLKTLILQDGTNSVSKSSKNGKDLFADYQKLVDKCMEKFTPDSMVLCEIPPFREIPINSDKNEKIAVFNDLLNNTYGNVDNAIVVLKLNDIIRSVSTYNPRITHFNQLYHDNVHLNYKLGIPFLKNILLGYLLKTSNGVIDFSKVTSNASYKMQNKFSNYQQRYFSQPPNNNLSFNRYHPY